MMDDNEDTRYIKKSSQEKRKVLARLNFEYKSDLTFKLFFTLRIDKLRKISAYLKCKVEVSRNLWLFSVM